MVHTSNTLRQDPEVLSVFFVSVGNSHAWLATQINQGRDLICGGREDQNTKERPYDGYVCGFLFPDI